VLVEFGQLWRACFRAKLMAEFILLAVNAVKMARTFIAGGLGGAFCRWIHIKWNVRMGGVFFFVTTVADGLAVLLRIISLRAVIQEAGCHWDTKRETII